MADTGIAVEELIAFPVTGAPRRSPSRSSTCAPSASGQRNCWSPPKIAVRHDDTAAAVAQAIDEAETRVREAVPIARVIYLVPDIRRPETAQPGG